VLIDYFAVYSAGGGTTSPPPPPTGGTGTQLEPTTDVGGGQDMGFIANGDWAHYANVDFGSCPAHQFSARVVASGAAAGVSGLVEVRLDSRSNAPIGSFAIANTGGWQSWRTVPANISAVTGVQRSS
jgi:Carbohydrate binding module (family 6)